MNSIFKHACLPPRKPGEEKESLKGFFSTRQTHGPIPSERVDAMGATVWVDLPHGFECQGQELGLLKDWFKSTILPVTGYGIWVNF